MEKSQKYICLNNGFRIPALGLGTFLAAPNEVSNAVRCALDVGYRHIDCAAFYGNEAEVGAAINDKITSGNISRMDVFVTSKLWCDSFKPKDVRPACEESLRKLGLEYMDLYLVHWPTAFQMKKGVEFQLDDPNTISYENVQLEETWKAMEGLVEAGLVRSIGVSNYNEVQIDRILKICKIKPVMNQVEVSVNCLNEKLIKYSQSNGIQITAYAPFGSPFLMADAPIPSPLNEEYVKKIATSHGKSPSQVLVRHALQRGLVVIPKSVSEDRIKSNFDVWDFELTNEDMKTLNTSGRNFRLFGIPALKSHPEYPFDNDC